MVTNLSKYIFFLKNKEIIRVGKTIETRLKDLVGGVQVLNLRKLSTLEEKKINSNHPWMPMMTLFAENLL